MEQMEKEEQPKQSLFKNSKATFAFGIIVVAVIGLIGIALYGAYGVKQQKTTPLVMNVAKALNLSAITVNGEGVSYVDYIRDKNVVAGFYEQQALGGATYSDEEITEQVTARLIANTLVSQIAADFDVTVTDEELDAAMDELLAQSPDPETAAKELEERFGWSIDQYKENVLFYILQEQALQEAFTASSPEGEEGAVEEVQARHILFQLGPDADEEAVRTEAESVLQRVKDGEDFAALALEFGSDGTASRGGDLGWFARGVMVPAFEEAAFALEPGQVADDLVETQFGYHIVQTTDKRDVRDFAAFMDTAIREATVVMRIDAPNPFDAYLAELDSAGAGQ